MIRIRTYYVGELVLRLLQFTLNKTFTFILNINFHSKRKNAQIILKNVFAGTTHCIKWSVSEREKRGIFWKKEIPRNQSWLFSQYNFTNLTNRYSVKTGCLNKFKFEDEFVFFLFYKHLLRHFDKSSRVNMFHDYRKTILFMRGGGRKNRTSKGIKI